MFPKRSSADDFVKAGVRERPTLRDVLGGGDGRSIGAANAVAGMIAEDAQVFGEAVDLMASADKLVRGRAADAVEKASRERWKLLGPFTDRLLGILALAADHQVRWHVLQMLPRLGLAGDEMRRACELAERSLLSESRIEAVEALSALCSLSEIDPALRAYADDVARRSLQAAAPAVRARARRLLKRRVHDDG